MNGLRKLPVFFHIPKNAGTFILNRIFAYSIAFNKGNQLYNRRVHVLKDGHIAYRIIVIDNDNLCEQNNKFKKESDRVFEIEFEDVDKKIFDSLYIFSVVVCDISFSSYKADLSLLLPEDIFLYKFISFREPFSRALSLYNYSKEKKSSHEEIHGAFSDLSLEEYISSDNIQDSWLIKRMLNLPDKHNVTQADFNSVCDLLDDFHVINYKRSSELIEDFFYNHCDLKAKDNKEILNLWASHYNSTDEIKKSRLEDLPKESRDIFNDKTFWDKKLYDKYTKKENKNARGKIVNCFYDGSTSGLGDFLRGSVHLYNHCMSKKIDFDVDMSHHPIKKFFKHGYSKKIPFFMINDYQSLSLRSGNFLHCLKTHVDQCLNSTRRGEVKYITSNLHPCVLSGNNIVNYQNKMPPLNRKCADWFRKKFDFCDQVNKLSEKVLAKNNLQEKEYDVLHFRLGDAESYSKEFNKEELLPRYKECLNKCFDFYENNKKPLIIMSDSNDFKQYIEGKNKNFIVIHLKSNHTQNSPCGFEGSTDFSDDNLLHTVLDMKLLTLARKVESHSIYYHGSGFAFWICKIYNVPFSMNIIK